MIKRKIEQRKGWRVLIPSFKGRMGREEFLTRIWATNFCVVLLVMLSLLILRVLNLWCERNMYRIAIHVIFIVFTYLVLMRISLHARRLHDVGRSGWWVICTFFSIRKGSLGLDAVGEPRINSSGVNPEERIHATGRGICRRTPRARIRYIYRKACSRNLAKFQMELARRYYDGYGVPQNREYAFYWLSRALDNKSKEAYDFLNSLPPIP